MVAVGFFSRLFYVINNIPCGTWRADPSYLTPKIVQMGPKNSDKETWSLFQLCIPLSQKQPVSKPLCKPPEQKVRVLEWLCQVFSQNQGQNLVEHGFVDSFSCLTPPLNGDFNRTMGKPLQKMSWWLGLLVRRI